MVIWSEGSGDVATEALSPSNGKSSTGRWMINRCSEEESLDKTGSDVVSAEMGREVE